jgi:hypothetical protein
VEAVELEERVGVELGLAQDAVQGHVALQASGGDLREGHPLVLQTPQLLHFLFLFLLAFSSSSSSSCSCCSC